MGFTLPFLHKFRSKKAASAFASKEFDPKEIYLSLDVGTRYIKAILFQIPSVSEIKIVGYARIAQKYGAMRDAMIVNLGQVIEACDICIGKSLELAERRMGRLPLPTKAVIGIAGELVRGVSVLAHYERSNPEQKIELEELHSVIQQVKEDSFAGALEDIAGEVGIISEQIAEISTKIDATHIDGQLVLDPLGFTGKDVDYRVYCTFAPKLHLNSLYDLARELGLEEATIVVQPYATARAMKELRQSSAGAIVVDMGGGTTDIALINNGGVLGTKMFAFGGDVLTKRIANHFNLELPAAEELKLDYSDGLANPSQQKEIRSILSQDLQIWVEGVQIALEELLDDEEGELEKLPSQIFLCGGGVALPEVRELLLEHPWLTSLPFSKFPKITYLYPNQLVGVTDETRLLVDPSDVTPAAIARMAIDVG